ncbi:MAG: NusA-like transcription termination signal-binding factor [Candidatus Altiarchaeota archaeon]|nr:NusA-like transcription termination signal-binding factor [Candidatus Altiarchaeota archaeon]
MKVAKLRYSTDDLKHIAFFESNTKAKVIDFLRQNDTLCFVIAKGDMGLAIGKAGAKIDKIRKSLSKQVIVFEFDDVPENFIKNMLHPIEVYAIEVANTSDEKTALVQLSIEDRSRAVGQGGSRLKIMKQLAKRHHNVDDIRIKAI